MDGWGILMQSISIIDTRVPRYTSYPTAPHFHSGIGPDSYRKWLEETPTEDSLSLYIHIPFCDTLCWFCGCHTTVVNNYAPVAEYCELLSREITLVAQAFGSRRKIDHIHLGGGSPTILHSEEIGKLTDSIHDNFDVTNDAEFALEVDPRELAKSTVEAFRLAGMTRASIGVQDCDPSVQKAINRVQPMEVTKSAIDLLRSCGIESINIDLLYGLPLQTINSWEDTLRFAVDMNADRLSVFGYAHLPSFKKHQALISAEALPDINTRLRQVDMAAEILGSNGYVAIGLDHYAKPSDSMAKALNAGSLARNFQGYTTDKAAALIGIGASAIGSMPQGYVQNHAAVPLYRASLAQNRLPIARGIMLTNVDRLRRHIIERLMCDLTVDVDEACTRHNIDATELQHSLDALDDYASKGVVSIVNGRVTIAPHWRYATRIVCSAFDAYLQAETKSGSARHSVAV